MKLFISYGHPQAEICRRICDVLRARGHQVWFDETHILHGADWRAEIVNGIITSEGVLSMIDRHSVRDPGVCLDEMSIAIGVRGGNIRYVLLEKQDLAEPPASMTTRQWLDMSDWRDHEDDSAWFEIKMDELIKMVESRENLEFTGLIEDLRRKLPMCHVSTSKQDSLLHQPFIGRAWVKDRVDKWLDDPEGTKICFVYGDPGIGKSAFAAHYMHYNGRVAAAIFCDYNNTQFNHPKGVIQTLAFLLACRLPDYRIALADALSHANDLGLYNVSELFDLLLAQPLSVGTVDGNRETMCIMIDGLDESGDRDRNILTEVFTKYADRLPKWLRILALSRRVEIITGLSGGADTIDITGGLEENKADVRAYFEDCLSGHFGGDENYTAMIDSLSENSGGIFLYATLMADALAKGKMSIEDTGLVPDGLDSAFYRWFQWFFPDIKEYENNWQMPLACVAASPEPIPEEEIKIVFGWTNTKLNKLKHTLEVLFRKDVNDFKKDTLQLSHRYISEWLFSDAAGRYQLDHEDAFQEMGTAFLEILRDDPKQLTAYEAYYLWDYVNALPRKKNIELLLNGELHGIVVEYGDYAKTWSRYETAMRYYTLSENLALTESEEKNGLDRLIRYGRSLSREGKIHAFLSQYSEALILYQKALELSEKIGDRRGTLDDLGWISVSYNDVAWIYERQSRYEDALKLYEKSLELSEKIVRERGTIDDTRRLANSHKNIANIYTTLGFIVDDLFLKILELRKKIAMEQGTLDDLSELAASFEAVASMEVQGECSTQNGIEDPLELYQKSIDLRKTIIKERGTLDDLRELAVSYKKAVEGVYKYVEQDKSDEVALVLYRKASSLFEKIAKERGTLDDLNGLSDNYNDVAAIYVKQRQYDDALQLYRMSLSISEKIVAERGIPDDLRSFSFVCNAIAQIYMNQDQCDEALLLYKKEVLFLENKFMERRTYDELIMLSIYYNSIAEIHEIKSQYEEAWSLYKKVVNLLEKVAMKRDTDFCQSWLSSIYVKFAMEYERQNRYDAALQLYKKDLELFEKKAKGDCKPMDPWFLVYEKSHYKEASGLNQKNLTPSKKNITELWSLDDLRGFSTSYNNIAKSYTKQSRYDKALELSWMSLQLRGQIPAELWTLDDLNGFSVSCEKIARIYLMQHQYGKALEMCNTSIGLRSTILIERKMLDDVKKLFINYVMAVSLYTKQSQYAEALEMYQKAEILWEKIVIERGTLEDLRIMLDVYDEVAEIYSLPIMNRYEEALEMYQKAVNLCEKVVSDRRTSDEIRYLCVIYRKAARIYEKQNRYDEALQLYQKEVVFFKKIAQERGTLDVLMGLSIGYENVAKIYEKQCQYEEALVLYQRAKGLCEKIATERGALDDMCRLYVSYANVASISEKQSRYEEALDLYQKAKDLCEKVYLESHRLEDKVEQSVLYKKIARIYKKQNRNEEASCAQAIADKIDEECLPFYRSDPAWDDSDTWMSEFRNLKYEKMGVRDFFDILGVD